MASALVALVLFVTIACALRMPIPFAYVFALLTIIQPTLQRVRGYRVVEFAVFLNASLAFSLLLAVRPYLNGDEIGFGPDMFSYSEGFDFLRTGQYDSLTSMLEGVASYTSSTEPVFWIIAKVFSSIFSSSVGIHVAISMLGFILIYLAGRILANRGLIAYLLYSSTITSYAFQGSGIRSGLAFCVMLLSVALMLRGMKRGSFLTAVGAGAVHYSMLPMSLMVLARAGDAKDLKRIVQMVILVAGSTLGAYLVARDTGEIGIGAKISAYGSQAAMEVSSTTQFFIESSCMGLFLLVYRNKIERNLMLTMLISFAFSAAILAIMPSAFPRYYRYEYVLFLAFFLSIFNRVDRIKQFMIVSAAMSWHIFLILDRFSGHFWGHGFADHFFFSLADIV